MITETQNSTVADMVKSTNLQHVAIIMDGNRRWAKEKNLPSAIGHKKGVDALKTTLKACHKFGIKYLTVYAFSTENWSRPASEIDTLMHLLEKTLDEYQQSAHKRDWRILISGERDRLPAGILAKMDALVRATAENKGISINLALNYGARQELAHAVNRLMKEGLTAVTPQDISRRLYQPEIPDPELIIRTSGEERLSNFLLWQAAYSEFYFTPVLWPDFNAEELQKALEDYRARKRRFGGV